jgi:hypothetical protein
MLLAYLENGFKEQKRGNGKGKREEIKVKTCMLWTQTQSCQDLLSNIIGLSTEVIRVVNSIPYPGCASLRTEQCPAKSQAAENTQVES